MKSRLNHCRSPFIFQTIVLVFDIAYPEYFLHINPHSCSVANAGGVCLAEFALALGELFPTHRECDAQ